MRLVRKRNLWVPTWQGNLAIVALLAAFAFFVVSEIHSFLARTERVDSEILVVEGWIPDYALNTAVREFNENGYRYLCTTGGPLDHGSHLKSFENWAKLAASTLLALGVPEKELVIAPANATRRYRTFHSARALKQILADEGIDVRAFNVVTLATHARRTQLVFHKVFGNGVEVGVVSIPSLDYEADRWWASSSGAKAVLTETIGWLGERITDYGRFEELEQN